MSIGTRRCTALRTRRTVFGTLLSMPCLSDIVFLRCLFQSEVSLYYQKADSSIKFQKKRRPHVATNFQTEVFFAFWRKCAAAWSQFFKQKHELKRRKCMHEMYVLRERGISAKPWRAMQNIHFMRPFVVWLHISFGYFRSVSSIPPPLHFAIGSRRMKRNRSYPVYMQAWHMAWSVLFALLVASLNI